MDLPFLITQLFIALDRLVNVIAGGYANSTISARVYYLSTLYRPEDEVNLVDPGDGGALIGELSQPEDNLEELINQGEGKWSAEWLRRVIDLTFAPLHGPDHCRKAWELDAYKTFMPLTASNMAILVPCVTFCCPIIAIVLRGYMALRSVFSGTWTEMFKS